MSDQPKKRKAKPGPKPGPPENRRDARLNVACRLADRAAWSAAAKAEGVTLSRWIENLAKKEIQRLRRSR